jgi:ankyrin repeat protein
MAAARSGYAPVVQLLVTAGADLRREDHTGRTALRYAQEAGRNIVIGILRRAGADR